ncbi:ABC transporter ATP-binding protein [Cellulomonas sp. Sa3CUA2]|uniref:ABC transporter ATP-binding protein n=1 Tax=Cellulomonas avistercoris TaxID=2762242 RepID=A0ABR8Q9F2_9CELL|nr:ABC transporter ATP-binding protein [Cellulomonas avistercoris]MBD7917052.1 ABC transporter ATP-binding protein [Cellulomonas avistercoris]
MRPRLSTYWSEAVEPRLFLFSQLRDLPRGLTTGVVALNVVVGLLPVAFVVGTSVVVGRVPAAVRDGTGSPAARELMVAFALTGATFLLQQVLTPVSVSLGQRLRHRVDGTFHDRLMAASLRSAGIAPLEEQESLSDLLRASEGLAKANRTPGDAIAGLFALVVRYSRLAGFLALIGVSFTWWAAGAMLVVTMAFRFGQRGGIRIYTRRWTERTDARREADYFRTLGMSAAAAKEMRVFGLAGWAKGRYERRALDSITPIWEERRRVSGRNFLLFTALGIVLGSLVLVAVLRAAAAGDLDLTALVLTLQAVVAATMLGEFYHEADAPTQFGMISARALTSFERRVADLARDDVASHGTAAVPTADLPVRGIRLADVTFRYPNASRPVLDGLDLELRAGECTAVVGVNGAGKTTLVKLLTRLYDPTEGAVLIDGTDLRDLPVDAWRRQVGVIFQDFNRYPFSAYDNIALGAVEHRDQAHAVRTAAHDAGILPTLEALGSGLETPLGRHQADGAELSGGQWQRVAIARALFAVAQGARVLVLDEPTAALDVRAEAAFFAEFTRLTRGVTTLLISHRFSSVRHADRIVVIDDGRVLEDGTHESLIASPTTYARLFHLQARRFAAGLEVDDASQDTELDADLADVGTNLAAAEVGADLDNAPEGSR